MIKYFSYIFSLTQALAAPGLLATLTLAAASSLAQAPAGVDMSAHPMPAQPRSALPSGWQHGAFMEIFVRAYQDSDGDGIGDLRGLTQRLDYLQELGVTGLWLMPITRSADHDHGYATTDYRDIEPAYGTLADLDELLRQAHARGIGVVMDYVINHSAAEHPLFLESLKGPDNPFRHWYVWSVAAPQGWDIWGKNPWYWAQAQPWNFQGNWQAVTAPPAGATGHYFGTFGPHMPDFNLTHPAVLAWHEDNLRFWLNRGLDGFRLDAVPHMIENDAQHWNDQPESRRLTKRLQDLITAYPQRYVVCEATAEPRAYGDPAVCGGAFAFGYARHFIQAAQGDAASVQELARYDQTASPTMATFLSNHDIFAGLRLWDQVQGDEARYKMAAAGYLLLPGTPFIYYGEEVGQASLAGLGGDGPIRGSMSWSAEPRSAGFSTRSPLRGVAPNAARYNALSQQADARSIRSFYKTLLSLRNSRPSLSRGRFEQAFADGLVLGFQRVLGGERSLVLINYGTASASVEVPGLAATPNRRALLDTPFSAEGTRVSLPAQSVQVLDLR